MEFRENARKAEQAASMNCERIETTRKSKLVESEIKKTKKFIEDRQPRMDEQDAIRQQYTQAMERFKEATTKIKQQKNALRVCAEYTNHMLVLVLPCHGVQNSTCTCNRV